MINLKKILLSGSRGRMGQAIAKIAVDHGCEISFPVDLGDDPKENIGQCDVAIDFSLRDATLPLVKLCGEFKKPVVIGTTGHENSDRDQILQIAKEIPIVWAGNFSTGVNLLFFLTEQISKVLDIESGFDPEIIEMHHKLKKDAPSGTAERLLEIIKESRRLSQGDISHGRSGMVGERRESEIGSHALRGGDVVGEHTVMFAGAGERIELTHRATDRVIFAAGALKAASWVQHQEPGLYSMQDVLGLTG